MSHNLDALFTLMPANDLAGEAVAHSRNKKFAGHWDGLEIRLSHVQLHPGDLISSRRTVVSLGRSRTDNVFFTGKNISRVQYVFNIDPNVRQVQLVDTSLSETTIVQGKGICTFSQDVQE